MHIEPDKQGQFELWHMLEVKRSVDLMGVKVYVSELRSANGLYDHGSNVPLSAAGSAAFSFFLGFGTVHPFLMSLFAPAH